MEADVDVNARQAQQARLREALRRDELELYMQPIVALERPGEWRMGEVLIRLRQEEKALLPPGEFLPAFEMFGMLPQLDCWVLRKVLQREARGRRFSINVSGPTLEHEALPALFAELAPPRGALLFEIEEADIVARPQAAQRFCETIRARGGGIVVDGFGRRSLSFASFAALRPEFLKIDGALTRPLPRDPSCAQRLEAIRRLAEALGVGLIAESIETEDVLLQLDALGVKYAQGYGIRTPEPMDALLEREPLRVAA